MRTSISRLALSLCLAGLTTCTQTHPPNVVWIVIDTLRADRTGFVGGTSMTPRLDGFARQSLVFTQAISSASWTKPSVATMFTSLDPRKHGVRRGLGEESDVLAEEFVTVAEVLQANGYRTLGIQGNPHLRSRFNMDQGFDLYIDRLQGRSGADFITEEARRLLRAIQGEPYFLYLHYMDVHLPHREHQEYSAMYGPHETELEGLHFVQILETSLSANDKKYLQDLYDGEVRYVDEQIGGLLEDLDDNTIVIVTSDHGEEFWDHGGFEHGHSLYDELIRVPLLIKVPGYEPQRIDSQVRLMDLAPTLLDALGIDLPSQFGGQSLLGVPQDSEDLDSWSESTLKGSPIVANRTGSTKVISHVKEGTFEAYDLSTDPLEQNPIEATPALKRKVQDFVAIEPHASQQELLDAATIERLKALGYIE